MILNAIPQALSCLYHSYNYLRFRMLSIFKSGIAAGIRSCVVPLQVRARQDYWQVRKTKPKKMMKPYSEYFTYCILVGLWWWNIGADFRSRITKFTRLCRAYKDEKDEITKKTTTRQNQIVRGAPFSISIWCHTSPFAILGFYVQHVGGMDSPIIVSDHTITLIISVKAKK